MSVEQDDGNSRMGQAVGDSLRVLMINTRGAGFSQECYPKVGALVDFAEAEGFNIVGATELHLTRAQEQNVLEAGCCYQGYWTTRDSEVHSRNDGILLLVQKAWAKYAQSVRRWQGQMFAVD